jgi:outer membrane protein OmpA-like peptidoglycan-associated protein
MPKTPAKQSRRLQARKATLLLLISVFVLQGCAVAVIGLGAGAGAVAYFNGKLTKTYESDYHETVRAARDTLQKLKIPETETFADELKTEIHAKRTDGTPVTIEVVRLDRRYNEVSVRTGSVGVWDRRVSEQIHGYIDSKLGGALVGVQKPQEGPGVQEAPPATQTEDIMEEHLDEISGAASAETPVPAPAPAPGGSRTGTDSGNPALEEKRLRAARMLVDSAYYIFFEKDSNALSPVSTQKLDQIYEIVSGDASARLTLNGYTDSWGTSSYNQMVSELRAHTVKSYLVGKGVDPSRITAVGHGAQNDIATNSTAEGRRLNRRVEIEITTEAQ